MTTEVFACHDGLDDLTGLRSKEAFFAAASAYLQRPDVRDASIVCFDVDHFKLLNDLHGLEMGDRLLAYLGRAFKERFSPDDAFPLGRLAADTFALCATGVEPACIERALIDIASSCPLGVDAIVRAGVYRVEDPAAPVSLMCDRAVIAQRTVKGSYFDRVATYDPGMRAALIREREVVAGIEAALRDDCIELFLQPKCNMRTGKIVGAEALARWRCDEYGDLPPLEFIPLLEESGLIVPMGAWVLRRAVDTCKKWRKVVPNFTMSVNLSYRQLDEDGLVPLIVDTLEEAGLPPGSLVVEMTESRFADDAKVTHELFDELRMQGVRVAMDDFGTGYSSLGVLKTSPADIVKIDRAFIRDIRTSTFDATFIRFVVELCHAVGISVCLEGVETDEEYEVVGGMGLDYIQGFLFGRPLPEDEFERRFLEGSV